MNNNDRTKNVNWEEIRKKTRAREERIEKLAQENFIASVKLFENEWRKLSVGFNQKFIKKMKEHSEGEIREIAKKIINEQSEELGKAIVPSIVDIAIGITRMESVLKANSLSTKFLNSLAIDNIEIAKKIEGELKPILSSNYLNLPSSDLIARHSPIILAKDIIIDDKEIEIPVDFANEEMVFNLEAYKALLSLEHLLRELIRTRIIAGEPGEKCNKLPPDMWSQWLKKQAFERKNPIIKESQDPVDYCDFTDFQKIFDKGKNFKLMAKEVNEQQFGAFIGKLSELEGIRLKIGHSRPITKEEFGRLILYVKDIHKLFKNIED
jgi:hypothetical protein